jgi:hypothetical protein
MLKNGFSCGRIATTALRVNLLFRQRFANQVIFTLLLVRISSDYHKLSTSFLRTGFRKGVNLRLNLVHCAVQPEGYIRHMKVLDTM